jgi:hypothetical protein
MACARSHRMMKDESYEAFGEESRGVMLGGFMGGFAGTIETDSRSSLREYTDSYIEEEDYRFERKRMINYHGDIKMQSASPEAVIDTVIERAKAKGGSIKERRNRFVSLQIPVAEFKDFFNYILTLGDVITKSINAKDITNDFADNATRLRIAEQALERMQELLKLAKTEQEKIAILKEIQRLSEQIEQRKLEEKELLRKAEFSDITLSVSNMPATTPVRINIKAFEWFAKLLNPNTHSSRNKKLKLQIPKDFIETADSKQVWSAASALNAKFWAYEKKNKPQGTADFWANAILNFFKSQYATELKTEENYSLIRIKNQEEIYYVAILKGSDKKKLKIAQAYFPSKEAEEKNSEAVKEVLKGVK